MQLLEREGERVALEGALAKARRGAASWWSRARRASARRGWSRPCSRSRTSCACCGARAIRWSRRGRSGRCRDVARRVGGPLAAGLDGGATRERLLAAILDELAAQRPSALVVEDLHWVDEATLDLLALLGRRLARSRGCLVVTCREDALRKRADVRRVLAALPRDVVRRIEPALLSLAAVRELAGKQGPDAAELHRVTGGNPFFVTEALAASPGEGVPASVREAVALRVAALPDAARAVVELAAVVPGPTELRLLAETVGPAPDAVDACLRAGILELDDDALAFRHDLARRAVAEELGRLRTRELDAMVLSVLGARGDVEPARLAHHAYRTGGAPAIRRLAPAAARAASAVGGHRQALEHWRRRSRLPATPTPRRSRVSPSRRTCAGGRSGRWRRGAGCSPCTRRRATRCRRARACAGWRASCGGRAAAPKPRRTPTGRSRRSSGSRRGPSWRWRSAAARSWRCWPSAARRRSRSARAPASSRGGSAIARRSRTR